ncbi:hypothetical protein [Aureibacillus halotolerans]|uniref:Uncharacterized protein n=1 Tax=Aureibacillus halotolerans TaxID=1508390 RepID=A0A4R6TPW2_9BACI|nr:hypothetical protein [Aureibacillus halotolerans]TDQ31901.1 hypothetical protein EV213_1346 [Aureibacillus halotolerans]
MYQIQLKRPCDAFWSCLTPSDWFQLLAVFIAAVAALLSFLSIVQSRKQSKENLEERRRNLRPIFKIISYDIDSLGKCLFVHKNVGYQFFTVDEAKWFGSNEIEVNKQFNGIMDTKQRTGSKVDFQEKTEVIITELNMINRSLSGNGFYCLIVRDIENNLLYLRSPDIQFENGRIINGINVNNEYLKSSSTSPLEDT